MPDDPYALAQPLPVLVQRFECPFCKRRRSARNATAGHIARCWLNPAAKACKTCANWDYDPGGDPCVPGEMCACNAGHVACLAGVEGIGKGEIKTGCLLWQPKAERIR